MPTINKKSHRPWMVQKEKSERWSNDNQAFYDSGRWRKLRHLQLQRFPLCRHCQDKGVLTPGRVADHIVPIKQGGKPLALDNLQTLCEQCHNKKSATERR